MENKRERFTYGYYKEFLSRLGEVYSFTTFGEGKKTRRNTDRPLLILRHDIDMDLESALRMASLENSLGIVATYFFQVRCPLYNVFSGRGAELVHGILSHGHYFGLHFDCALYKDIAVDNINGYVNDECSLLESFFNRPVEAVSFHRPGPLELSGINLDRWPNTYEEVFLKRFEYFSDSRGDWARGNPLDSEAFSARKNLHILAHPVWWTETPLTPYECLVRLVERLGSRAEEYISASCQVWDTAGHPEAVTDNEVAEK